MGQEPIFAESLVRSKLGPKLAMSKGFSKNYMIVVWDAVDSIKAWGKPIHNLKHGVVITTSFKR